MMPRRGDLPVPRLASHPSGARTAQAREEAQLVIFFAMNSSLRNTGLNPSDIDIFAVSWGMFSPTPSPPTPPQLQRCRRDHRYPHPIRLPREGESLAPPHCLFRMGGVAVLLSNCCAAAQSVGCSAGSEPKNKIPKESSK
ncbi:hypothetical protein OROGR_028217 [Orobanche gracilis]